MLVHKTASVVGWYLFSVSDNQQVIGSPCHLAVCHWSPSVAKTNKDRRRTLFSALTFQLTTNFLQIITLYAEILLHLALTQHLLPEGRYLTTKPPRGRNIPSVHELKFVQLLFFFIRNQEISRERKGEQD